MQQTLWWFIQTLQAAAAPSSLIRKMPGLRLDLLDGLNPDLLSGTEASSIHGLENEMEGALRFHSFDFPKP